MWIGDMLLNLPKNNPLGSTGLIIAGFHRSGTSALTQMLHTAGFDAGDDLSKASEFNKVGHFESMEVVRLHDRIMGERGVEWTTPLSVGVEVSETHIEEIRAYIDQRAEKSKFWCVKDPRVVRFLHEWKAAGSNLKFLIVYRNPAESVYSLQRREMMKLVRSGGMREESMRFYENPDLGAQLWRDHNKALLEFAKQHPEDSAVVGHTAIANGFDVLDLMSKKLLEDMPTKQHSIGTFDEGLVTKNVPILNVKDPDLKQDIEQIWNEISSLDASAAWDGDRQIIERSLHLDANGTASESRLLRLQLEEANRIIRLQKDSVKLVRKVSQPPFSWYFLQRQKYRKICQDIAGSLKN